MTAPTPPVCAFCGVAASPTVVFDTNSAVGMHASLRTCGSRKEVVFQYGSEFDGDICLLADNVVIGPGTFSACDDCGQEMLSDGRLKLKCTYLDAKKKKP